MTFGGQDEGWTCRFRYAPYDNLIQWSKRLACGYLARERFRNAIFHLGGLDLYPDAPTHTKS